MIRVEKLNTADRQHVRRFIELPFSIYADCPQWVPPIRDDLRTAMNRDKHPFYEHSTADFFIATRDGRDVGRIAALYNTNYIESHDDRAGQFYFFECEDDSEVAAALFDRAFEWARERKMERILGPKGFSPFDGYGLLQKGFEHRQMMNMANYNPEYYLRLVAEAGFEKEVDFISHRVAGTDFNLDPRVPRVAARVEKRSKLRIVRFKTKRQLKQWSDRVGVAYNNAFVENWEFVPMTERELKFVIDDIMLVVLPHFVKVIAHEEEVVGFMFAFPDISAAMQRRKGKLWPVGIFDLLLEMRRSDALAVNGAGILPAFQGRGGNAILYTEMEKTIKESNYRNAEFTQVAETAVQMRRDLETLGGEPYKNHRVFGRVL